MFTVVAPASITASTTWARNSSSVREASSGENSTSSQNSRAIRTPSTALRRISSLAMLSLYWRWMALVARKTWMRCLSASRSARAAFSMSSRLQRARPQMMGPWTSRATELTDAQSPGEAAGKPASITSTPRSASAFATRSFSGCVMLHPGDCSPSRSVVSKIITRSAWTDMLNAPDWRGRMALNGPGRAKACGRAVQSRPSRSDGRDRP